MLIVFDFLNSEHDLFEGTHKDTPKTDLLHAKGYDQKLDLGLDPLASLTSNPKRSHSLDLASLTRSFMDSWM